MRWCPLELCDGSDLDNGTSVNCRLILECSPFRLIPSLAHPALPPFLHPTSGWTRLGLISKTRVITWECGGLLREGELGAINNITFLISQARKQLEDKILEMSTLVLIKAKKKDMT